MTPSRRLLLLGSPLLAAPALVRPAAAQAAPPRNQTLRCVMHADLAAFDPIATTASITAYHGALIYDTLFGHDAGAAPRPQMVQSHEVSPDGLQYSFVLREALRFHDGQPVTARDCVASLRRWGARDGAGQHLFRAVADVAAQDERRFGIRLNAPYPLLLDWLGKSSPSICFIMRESDASTDPARPITDTVGSGPYTYNRAASRSGAQYVYDRNPSYQPRQEPASGFAGGKVARMARVVFQNMPDEQTAVSALLAGEIDFIERASPELQTQLARNPRVKLERLNQTGSMGWLRMNHLQAPFNNVLARRAMLHLVNQAAMMQASFPEASMVRSCASLFACGTTMENDANTGWHAAGQDIPRAAALFREAGYDGRPVVILQQTTQPVLNNCALLLAQWLRQAGVAAELVPLDWAGIVARRARRGPPAEGGWNIFMTFASGSAYDNPITLAGHAATGERGWFGWPEDARHEQLRDAWAAAPGLAARQAIAREMQDNAWNFVPHVYMGQWFDQAAMRADVNGLIHLPDLVPFWNVNRG